MKKTVLRSTTRSSFLMGLLLSIFNLIVIINFIPASSAYGNTKDLRDFNEIGYGPCAKDIKKFCGSAVAKNKREIGKCLRQHEDQLSLECKTKRDELRAKYKKIVQSIRMSCSKDIEKYCQSEKEEKNFASLGDESRKKGLRPKHKTFKCLREHKNELSDECQKVLSSIRDLMHK